jgi:hypothetical protein
MRDAQDAEDRSIAVAIHQAIVSSVRLELLPKSTVDIFLIIVENDGVEGCVAAGSIAASTALADAGIDMIGLVVSCSGVSIIVPRFGIFNNDCPSREVGCRVRNMAGSNPEGNASIKGLFGSVVHACAGNCHECMAIGADETTGALKGDCAICYFFEA